MAERKYNSIVEAVFAHSEDNPQKLCLADEKMEVTYGEYVELIEKTVTTLKKSNIIKGDKVVIEASQTVSYLACELALQLLGAIFVPVERNCSHEKIVDFANWCEAKLIVTAKEISNWDNGKICFSELEELIQNSERTQTKTFPAIDEISEILFSTGTTGKEKGIVITHKNNIALAENVIYGVEMQEDNVEMIPSPMNHSHGLRRYYANMVNGSTVVLLSGVMNLKKFFDNIDEYGVNSMDLVPTALSVLLKLSKDRLICYRDKIRYIQLGAAPLMATDKERIKELLPNTRLYNFYGSTESGCICIYNFNQSDEKDHCIGRPAHNAKIIMVDEDRNEIKSSKTNTGLLASFGDMNMREYWMDEEETSKALKNGFVYSNDEAYFDEDGDIILLGRKGDVINVGGNKVTPDEIENAAKKLNGIKDCGCISVPDDMKGNVPKLFVQMSDGFVFDKKQIRNHLASLLEPYKVPKYIVRIDKIPRTYNGKIIRKELQHSK